MCLLPCFLWWAPVSAWIYGNVLGICFKPRCEHWVLRRMEKAQCTSVLSQPEPEHEPSPGSPYISRCCQGWHRTQHRRDHSAASSLAFLSEMMTPCFWWWRTSAQHVLVLQAAQVMSLPQGRAQPPPCSSALGQPAAASCQPLPPPSRFQSWRGFPELKYLAYK